MMSESKPNMLISCPTIDGKCTQFSLMLKRCNSQVAVTCQVCKESRNVKWRCMDCLLKTICERCKDNHSQNPSFSKHTIVNLTDPPVCKDRMEQRLGAEFRKKQCTKHNIKTYNFFCRTCNFLVCPDCITEVHSNHNLAEISQYVKETFLDDVETSTDYTKLYNHIERQDSVSRDSFCLLMTEFELVHTVRTELPAINQMTMVKDDEAYIWSLDRNMIIYLQLNTTGFLNKMQKLSDSIEVGEIEGFLSQPMDITINLKGDLLFISDHCLKLMTKNAQGQTKILDLHDFYPLNPNCVHYDKERDITWVGLIGDDSNFQLTKRSVRKVVAVNQRTLYKEFQYTEENKRLFTLPVKIFSIQKGGICMIDRVSQTTGRVISLNAEGILMWIYKDPPPSSCSHPFNPTDLTITNTQIIIVVDSCNRAFHILNTKGTLILHQSSIHLGIERPFCLDTDESGYLWVGCLCDSTSRETGAKMYKLKIKGL